MYTVTVDEKGKATSRATSRLDLGDIFHHTSHANDLINFLENRTNYKWGVVGGPAIYTAFNKKFPYRVVKCTFDEANSLPITKLSIIDARELDALINAHDVRRMANEANCPEDILSSALSKFLQSITDSHGEFVAVDIDPFDDENHDKLPTIPSSCQYACGIAIYWAINRMQFRAGAQHRFEYTTRSYTFNQKLVSILIKMGTDPNLCLCGSDMSSSSNWSLFEAVRQVFNGAPIDIVKIVANALGKSTLKDEKGRYTNGIDRASFYDNMDFGAGNTVLSWAINFGLSSVVRVLIDAGADLSQKVKKKKTFTLATWTEEVYRCHTHNRDMADAENRYKRESDVLSGIDEIRKLVAFS